MHLVISTHSPQYVFATNMWDGAWHLARRIVELDEEMREVVDLGIYTKDRAMRMLGSSKYDKKQSVLEALDPSQAVRDHVITWLDDNTQYLTRDEHVAMAGTIDNLFQRREEDVYKLNQVIEDWRSGDFAALNIKAPMGSGKTTLLNTLIDKCSPKTVVIITYRQSLAQELGRKIEDFDVYLDVDKNDFPGLESEEKYPEVIVQLDSLDRLSPTTIRRFDIVVVDEMVSVLRHISAKTLDRAMHVAGLLTHHLQKASKVITMDAFWNEDCFQFLKRLDIPQKLVINDFRPPPRTYRWTRNEALLVQRIKEDLIAGKNVAVTSMASEFCHRLMRQLVDEGILTEEEIIMHTGMTDDKLREMLRDVDALWVLARLLIYSPTIEAVVEEVIQALGLSGPFDTAHIIEDLSSGEVRERVLSTECFQAWAHMRKIFNIKATTTVWNTSSELMGPIRVILDSIGLTVSNKRTRGRETGTESRTYSYKYWLSTDSVNKMQELLALKDGDAEKAGKWAHLLTPHL
eukprot:jgi/Astpho2/6759/fgenesh1_pg.00102_%23_32_t